MITKVAIDVLPNLFHYEDGWTGAFTRDRAPGALPNGTIVQKIRTEKGDEHKVGERAVVLGSIREAKGEQRIMYFVEWENMPKCAVAIVGWKLGRAS